MRPIETTQHSQEIESWAAVYKFNYPAEFDALVDAYGKAKGERIAAERRYAEYHDGQKPNWPPFKEHST